MSAMTDLLPNEIYSQIFSYLSPSDLKAAALVCRSWEAMVVGEHKLWTWAVITINTLNDVKMKLEVPKLKQIKTIRMGFNRQRECLEEVFEAILAYPSIKTIYGMEYWNLKSVNASAVAGVLSRLDELEVGHMGCRLSKSQYEQLFTVIAKREEPMQKLFVDASYVSGLSPAVIAAAVTNVKELELCYWSDDQVRALLRHIVEKDVPLAILKISRVFSLETIAPDLVGSAFNRLTEVDMFSVISNEHATAVLKGVVEGGSKLQKLWLREVRPKGGLDRDLVKQVEKKINGWILCFNDK